MTGIIAESKNLIDKIEDLCRQSPEVHALVIYGSWAMDENDLLSDVDLFILTHAPNSIQKKLNRLKPSLNLNYENRSVLYFNKPKFTIKLDIVIHKSVEKLYILQNYKKIKVLFDRDGVISSTSPDPDLQSYTLYHMKRIIECYHLMLCSRQSHDRYRYMFYQFLVLQHLYTIEYHLAREILYSYLPKQLLYIIPSHKVKKYYKNFDPISDFSNSINRIEEILSWIYDIITEVESIYPNSTKGMKESLDNFTKQSLYFNWRDIASINPTLIKENVMYRGSSPSLNPFVLDIYFSKIKSSIDLRNKEEIEESSYDSSSICYYNVPIGEKHVKPHRLKYTEIGIDPFFYEYFPRHYGDEIVRTLRLILSVEQPILLHCQSGKDRTGMIVALIHKLLGLSNDEVIRDYLSSRFDTSKEKISIFLKVIDEYGGVDDYLLHEGMKPEELDSLRATFLTTNDVM